jgi:hypothetical protein
VNELIPIGAGAILAIGVAGRSGLRGALAQAGLALAIAIGVAVAFLSGEWREGAIFPIWDAFQGACAYALTLVAASQLIGRRARHEEG